MQGRLWRHVALPKRNIRAGLRNQIGRIEHNQLGELREQLSRAEKAELSEHHGPQISTIQWHSAETMYSRMNDIGLSWLVSFASLSNPEIRPEVLPPRVWTMDTRT
ncbi:hypothetical protein BU15DRAFT_60151 [Melanogaster broomeanus]|nr:hypothetical protein BU15DRAFT_60151 [Melanogaster broomeanus]